MRNTSQFLWMPFVPELEEVGIHFPLPSLSENSKPPKRVCTAFLHYLKKLAEHLGEQIVLGISDMCAHGCVACWVSEKLVFTS